jgi:hypothetical protein
MRRAVVALGMLTALLLLTVQAGAASSGSRFPKCAGTYLYVGDAGDYQLWTFSADGTAQLTNSTEDVFAFTHEQGAWRQLPSGVVHLTTLDFPVDNAVTPATISRVDASVTFAAGCATFSGSLELRTYSIPSQDPLDPADGSHVLFEDFSARQVTAP